MMCKQTVCIKWWVAVIVGFLLDTAKPCLTSAEGATFLRGVGGCSPPENFEKSRQNGGIWWCLWHYSVVNESNNFFSEAMCTQLRICIQGATPMDVLPLWLLAVCWHGKWLHNQETPRCTTWFDTPTDQCGVCKIFFTFDFHILL